MKEENFRSERNKLDETRREKHQVRKEVIAAAKEIIESSKEEARKALVTLEHSYAGKIDGQFDRGVGMLKKKYNMR